MGGSGWVDHSTVQSDFGWGARWRAEIAHLDHGIPKLNKEEKLAGGKCVDNGSGISPRRGEKLLVTLEKPLVVSKIDVVVFVECDWCDWVKVYSCRWGGAGLTKLLSVSSVQSRVWEARVVEVVEPPIEEKASGSTERVRS